MRRKRKSNPPEEPNMTPMIDIVFQMIIFFVCTVEMERQSLLESIKLATSPNGPAVENIIPGTVKVDVDGNGRIYIARVPYTFETFTLIMRKTVAQSGNQVPVVIRGDSNTKHRDIKKVMDACKGAGLWKVKFAAVKEEA